ncbi:MAG: glycosyltransferase family 4 protein [Candidatus Bathyarchaeia archaeon]
MRSFSELRILIIHPHIFPGGAEKVIVNLASQLSRRGHKVALATLSVSGDFSNKLKNVELWMPSRGPYNPADVTKTSDALRISLRETASLHGIVKEIYNDYDLINPCNFPSYWSIYGILDPPCVWYSSEVFAPVDESEDLYERNPFFRISYNIALHLDKYIVNRYIKGIITLSEWNARQIKARYGRTSIVVHSGIDYQYYSRRMKDAKEILGLAGKFVLLHVGKLVKRKNHILTLRILRRIRKTIPEVFLIIVGSGPYRSRLIDYSKIFGVSDIFKIFDRVNEETLRTIYYASDVCLYPVYNQSFGVVPLEAMVCGVPSIVSSDSGVGEIMRDNGIEYVVDPTDEETIIRLIIQIYRDPSKAKDMAKRGKEYVKRNLTWKKVAYEYEKALKRYFCEK